MFAEAKELWRYRELLLAMTERELRIRYKNSILGFFWSLAMPLATVIVMTLVFKNVLGNQTPNYGAYVLAAYLPFVFMNTALLDSAQSVLSALPIVKKVYFPREILPLSSVFANFIHFCLSLTVFFCYLFVVWAVSGFQVSPFTFKLFWLPPLLVLVLMFTAGSSLLISALNVFYEDVKHAITLLLYLVLFLTPVMYFSESIYYRTIKHPSFFYIYHLNPLAAVVTSFRKVLLPVSSVDIGNGEIVKPIPFAYNYFFGGYFFLLAVVFLLGGYAIFNRLKWKFMERP